MLCGKITDGNENRPRLLKDAYPEMLVNVGLYKFDLSTNDAYSFNLNNLVIGAASVAIVSVLETMISAKYAAHRTETKFS